VPSGCVFSAVDKEQIMTVRIPVNKRIVCLNIPDDYGFMDRELINLLISTVSEHIEVHEMVDD
jgi:predicted protein tyrosine phosphatase